MFSFRIESNTEVTIRFELSNIRTALVVNAVIVYCVVVYIVVVCGVVVVVYVVVVVVVVYSIANKAMIPLSGGAQLSPGRLADDWCRLGS